MGQQKPNIVELITQAPWREAVTYRDTWPHEYVLINQDTQKALLDEFLERITRGEGVYCHFFHQTRPYLFLGDYKYWIMTDVADANPSVGEVVLNRALLYKDRRDFLIRRGDTGKWEEQASMSMKDLGRIEEVSIRSVWPNEARDFTPWLAEAENLTLLGEALAWIWS